MGLHHSPGSHDMPKGRDGMALADKTHSSAATAALACSMGAAFVLLALFLAGCEGHRPGGGSDQAGDAFPGLEQEAGALMPDEDAFDPSEASDTGLAPEDRTGGEATPR
jgi:hypothetical protein